MIARGNDYHSLCFVKNFDVQSKIHKKQKENKNKRTALNFQRSSLNCRRKFVKFIMLSNYVSKSQICS